MPLTPTRRRRWMLGEWRLAVQGEALRPTKGWHTADPGVEMSREQLGLYRCTVLPIARRGVRSEEVAPLVSTVPEGRRPRRSDPHAARWCCSPESARVAGAADAVSRTSMKILIA